VFLRLTEHRALESVSRIPRLIHRPRIQFHKVARGYHHQCRFIRTRKKTAELFFTRALLAASMSIGATRQCGARRSRTEVDKALSKGRGVKWTSGKGSRCRRALRGPSPLQERVRCRTWSSCARGYGTILPTPRCAHEHNRGGRGGPHRREATSAGAVELLSTRTRHMVSGGFTV